MNISELLEVKIEFSQSHLFFPQIVHWLLLIMAVLILLFEALPYLREVRAGRKQLPFVGDSFDHLRFFGTLVLTLAYFLLMPLVGGFFPNTGLGFLLMSIPYIFLLSLLYQHTRDRHHLLLTTINAIAAPVIAWYVLAKMFAITLP